MTLEEPKKECEVCTEARETVKEGEEVIDIAGLFNFTFRGYNVIQTL